MQGGSDGEGLAGRPGALPGPGHRGDRSVFPAVRAPECRRGAIHTRARCTEGPVSFGDGRYLLWSDIPNNRLLRWCEDTESVSVFRSLSDYGNGNTRDRQAVLSSANTPPGVVTRTDHDGSLSVLMDQLPEPSLNAPNDVVVHPDGLISFSDPSYGILVNYERF